MALPFATIEKNNEIDPIRTFFHFAQTFKKGGITPPNYTCCDRKQGNLDKNRLQDFCVGRLSGSEN